MKKIRRWKKGPAGVIFHHKDRTNAANFLAGHLTGVVIPLRIASVRGNSVHRIGLNAHRFYRRNVLLESFTMSVTGGDQNPSTRRGLQRI